MDVATAVWRELSGLPPRRSRVPTRQSVLRSWQRLRALDGHLAGATRREIAAALFGRDRVPLGPAWKTSDLRSRTLRLVSEGVALMNGGYLRLLA